MRPPVVCSASRARQQTRVFCCAANYAPQQTKQPGKKPSLHQGRIILRYAFQLINDNYTKSSSQYEKATMKMLQGLDILEKVAANADNCSDYPNAKNLLDEVVKPIIHDLQVLEGAARSSIVKASLRAISKLLQTAPPDVGTTLRQEIYSTEVVRSSIEKIIRDTAGGDDEMRSHAREILESTTQ
jgi:hypothetical protein